MNKVWMVGTLLLIVWVVPRGHARIGAAKPDVFLVTIDTLRSDHVHCYGYESIQTPALDDLARHGILFAQAFTPSPITTSSHVSIMTGLLPSSHGVTDFGMPLIAQHSTIAELLERSGYQTAAFIGSVVLDSKSLAPGLDRGFLQYDNFPANANTSSRWGRIERRATDVEARAEKWLEVHHQGPRFVWIHFYDPHDPYEPPPPYSETYKQRLYDGEIAYADAALARLIARLKQENAFDNALIIAMSDHGEGLGEHHEDTHGIFLYDSTTHVPLLMKLPANQDAGRVIREQVRTIDVMPTILDLLGLPIPSGLDGSSLGPILSGADTEQRATVGETNYPLHFGWAPLRSLRKPGFKFIEAPRPEVYDLLSDPKEVQNRYEPWDPFVQKAREALAKLRSKQTENPADAGAVPHTTMEELRALGYFTAADAKTTTQVPEPSLLPDPKDKIEQQNLIHSSMIASEDGRLADARKSLQEVLRQDESSVAALSELGRVELSAGNYRFAADYLQRATKIHPSDPGLDLELGRALYKLHDLAGARGALQESTKLNPNQTQARLLLARVYFDLKENDAADDQLAAMLVSDPSKEKTTEVARLLVEHAKFAEAIELLEPLADTEDGEQLKLLAKAYKGAGRLKDAQKAELKAAGRAEPKSH